MPSLWTDNDTGGHPWLAAPPHPGATGPAPPAAHSGQDDPSPGWRLARPTLMAAACLAAVIAGALVELLR